MAERENAGPYRASWDLLPVVRVFMEAIRSPGEPHKDDREPVKQMKATLAGVRASLRDAVDAGRVLEVEEDDFCDAVDTWLLDPHGCEALGSLLDAGRRVREGGEAGLPDTPAGLAVEACVAHHGGVHCSAGQFLLALFHDCRREGRGHCLGVPLLEGGGQGCQAYPLLDDAARRCLALNGVRCHAADDLDDPDPVEGDSGVPDADDNVLIRLGAGESGGPEADSAVPDTDEEAAGDDAATSLLAVVWGWARQYNLVADRAALRRSVAEFGADPLLPEIAYHKAFLLVAFNTLRAWASSPEARDALSWHYPDRKAVAFDDRALCLFHRLPDHVSPGEEGMESDFVCRQDDFSRYEIVFRPAKWNPFEETNAAAVKRITGAFERHLAAMLAAHHEVVKGPDDKPDRAKEVGDVVPASRELDAVHAKWLVIYQVCGLPKSTIGEIEPRYKGREPAHLSEIVGRDVRKAAALLLGPRYELWLRPSRDGRPPGLTNKTPG